MFAFLKIRGQIGIMILTIVAELSLGNMGFVHAVAQSGAPSVAQTEVRMCDPDLIDGTFTFYNRPLGEQTVSLHFRNAGPEKCRLHGRAGPSFGVDGHSMHISECWLCDAKGVASFAPERDHANAIVLAPGETAALDFHWKTSGPSCQWADDVDFFVDWLKKTGYVFTPANWPMHICSPVMSSGYREETEPHNNQIGAALRVTVAQEPIYTDERTILHVQLVGQRRPEAHTSGCSNLYSIRHVPASATLLDPLHVIGAKLASTFTEEQRREDDERKWPSWTRERRRACDIPPGSDTADVKMEASDLKEITHLVWRTSTTDNAAPVFVTSPAHFNVLDPDTLDPNWGDDVQGIRTGLSIDRTEFKPGESIPVHLRWENRNASKTLGQGECLEPQPILELQDSQHRVLQTMPGYLPCFTHGWGPFKLPTGKIQRLFRSESLPASGTYYLVSVWSARLLEENSTPEEPGVVALRTRGKIGNIYATARSKPVRIVIRATP